MIKDLYQTCLVIVSDLNSCSLFLLFCPAPVLQAARVSAADRCSGSERWSYVIRVCLLISSWKLSGRDKRR